MSRFAVLLKTLASSAGLAASVLLFTSCFLVSFIGGCSVETTELSPSSGRLLITGSSTVAPLVTEMAKRYEALHPDVRIDVQAGGSGKGISDARGGVVDIGMASRALKPEEADLQSHRIAADGVGIVVHQTNEVNSLTTDQVRDLYLNETNSWQSLGGSDLEVTVVHKAEGRATLEVFLTYFDLDNREIRPDVIVGDNEHGIRTVAGTAGAIGYVSIGTAESDIQSGLPIRLVSVDGIEATTQAVASGQFPITRPLNLVTYGSVNPLVEAFIAFCQSDEVDDLIEAQYFVPVSDS